MTGLMSERSVVTENKIAVQPGTERWNKLVSTAVAKDADRNWFLGDAALEISPMGERGTDNGSGANLRQYATEIGIEFNSLRTYRDVAAAWPIPTRVGIVEVDGKPVATSWKVHQMLAGRQELIRPGMTVTQAHVAMGQSIAGRTGPNSTPVERAQQARGALADPAVREELRRINTARLFELEAQAIANGGRVPSLEEVNAGRRDSMLDQAVAALGDEHRRTNPATNRDVIVDLEQAVHALRSVPIFDEDGPEAARLQQCSLMILDRIATKKVRP